MGVSKSIKTRKGVAYQFQLLRHASFGPETIIQILKSERHQTSEQQKMNIERTLLWKGK